MKVPFVNLKEQNQAINQELMAQIEVLSTEGLLVLGKELEEFEKSFAKYLSVNNSIGVASGTDALLLAYKALNIGQGDEVIVPAHTFCATALAVLQAGARPVLVDVSKDTYNIDLSLIEKAITPRTKAICPVHLYGRACNMDAILEIAKNHKLHIVEDAAQAHGAYWKNRRVGTFGSYGAFSFYPAKNLGAYGDGGALVTNSSDLALKIKNLRNYGSVEKYSHPELGYNSRLDTLQAIVLSAKLKHLDNWNMQRFEAAKKYNQLLSSVSNIILPELCTSKEHVFHLYVIQVANRDRLRDMLLEEGIQTSIHYPKPYYLEKGFSLLEYKRGDFPVTEKLSESILSLPIFPGITDEQIEYACTKLIKALVNL